MAFLVRVIPLTILVACSLSPESGQYRCDDSDHCPADFLCVDHVCQSNPGVDAGVDTGVDGGVFDGGVFDGGVFDGGGTMDAGPFDGGPENCARDRNQWGVDEDGDGTIDEGCGWHFGTPHIVPNVHSSPFHYGVAFNGEGDTVYLATSRSNEPIQTRSRSVAGLDFGIVQDVPNTTRSAAAVVVTVSADEDTLVTQTEGGLPQLNVYRRLDSRFGAPNTLFIGSYHPWLSSDASELFSVFGFRPDINRAVAEGATFVHRGQVFANASFPSLAPGGRYVFFVRDDQVFFARREDPESAFGDVVPLAELDGFFRPVYLPRLGEMWIAKNEARSQRRIYRVQVCRDEACREDPVQCDEPGAVQSDDGFHCYWVAGANGPQAQLFSGRAARTACGDGHLATIVSANEQSAIESLVGREGAWIGLAREDCGATNCPVVWQTGEPELWREGGDRANDTNACAYSAGANWTLAPCANERAVLCEREAYPTWISAP